MSELWDASQILFSVYRYISGRYSTKSCTFAIQDISIGQPPVPSASKFTELVQHVLDYDATKDIIQVSEFTLPVTVKGLLDWMVTGRLVKPDGKRILGEAPLELENINDHKPSYCIVIVNLKEEQGLPFMPIEESERKELQRRIDSLRIADTTTSDSRRIGIPLIERLYPELSSSGFSMSPSSTIGLTPGHQIVKVRLLIACTGSIATVKLPMILGELEKYSEFVSVQVILTPASTNFIASHYKSQTVPAGLASSFPNFVERVWTDEDEWLVWTKIGDPVVHIELRKWADVLLIAPLSANFMAKMANGLVEGLLGGVVRAWDRKKTMMVAPAMNTLMWEHPLTKEHVEKLHRYYNPKIIHPVAKKLACGDVGVGGMEEWSTIVKRVLEEFGIAEKTTPVERVTNKAEMGIKNEWAGRTND